MLNAPLRSTIWLPNNCDARWIGLVTFIDYGLLCSSAQPLFIRVSRLLAVPAYDLGSDLNPDQPIVFFFVPGNLDSVSTHISKIAKFAESRQVAYALALCCTSKEGRVAPDLHPSDLRTSTGLESIGVPTAAVRAREHAICCNMPLRRSPAAQRPAVERLRRATRGREVTGGSIENCSDSVLSMESRFAAGTTLSHAVAPVTGLYSAMRKPS
jgi:hypothetical protein